MPHSRAGAPLFPELQMVAIIWERKYLFLSDFRRASWQFETQVQVRVHYFWTAHSSATYTVNAVMNKKSRKDGENTFSPKGNVAQR